jgi:hypothetical protein
MSQQNGGSFRITLGLINIFDMHPMLPEFQLSTTGNPRAVTRIRSFEIGKDEFPGKFWGKWELYGKSLY